MAQSTYGLEQKDIADISKMLVASGAAGTHGGEGYINSGQFDSQGNVFANYFEGKGQSAPFATYDKIGNRSFSQDAYQSWLNNPANLQGLLSSMYPNGDRNLSSGPGGYSYANGTPIAQIPDRDAPGSGLPTPGQTPGMVLPGAPSSQPIAPPTYNKPGAPNILGKPSVGTPGQYSLAGGFDSQYANPYTVNGQTFFSQNGPVDTSTPNPNSVNAAPYTQGLAAMQQSGQKAPQDAASARTAVAGASAPGTGSLAAQQRSAAVVGTLQNDPNYQQLLADYQEYNHVANQQKSLVDTYQQLISAAGIPGIDASLLNSKRIIDGTEDDIRSEVQAVSGFATDSQVQALASARNKVLIKNYNNLLNTKTLAMQQVQTMIGLAAQDQENALSHITQKLNIDAQIADYSMKFQANAAAAYERVIQAVGYQGLLQSLSSDPSAVNLAEQTLGLAPGGLQQIATQQQNQLNLANIQAAGITTPYVNVGGEIRSTATGQGFVDPTDFKNRTGLTLEQAGNQGLITNYAGPLDQQIQREQLEEAKAQAPLDLALKRAQIAATNRSNQGSGGGGRPAGPLGLTNQQIDNISPLVTQFQNSPIVQNYNTIGEGYKFVKSLSNTTTNPADDQALIYALAKALDPGSVVREGEYNTAQKYSQSWVQSYGKGVTQALAGTGFLSGDARRNIKATIESRFKAAESSYNNLYNETSRRVNLIGNTDKGNQLLNNYGGAFAQPSTPSTTTQESAPQTEQKGFLSTVVNWLWGE